MRRLRALEIPEERELAGRVAGLLYLTASTTVSLLLVLPGTVDRNWAIVLSVAALGVVWGAACLFAIPWRRVHPVVSHFSSAMGFPLTAIAAAATGGATSPARFYLLFIVVYCSYFYPPREAVPYLVGCLVVLLLPLAYDAGAIDDGLLGEALVLIPIFFVLGGLIMSGKRVLVDLTRRDTLTGLPNRRAFTERIAQCTAPPAERAAIGLLLCDLDWFKDVNTLYGLPVGDHVLRETASALRDAVGEDGMVARLGGDEFVVAVPAASETAIADLARRMLAALEETDGRLELPGYRLRASVGWAVSPRDGEDLEELITTADIALRRAKGERTQAGGRRGAERGLGAPAARFEREAATARRRFP